MSKMSQHHARLCESGAIDPDEYDDSGSPDTFATCDVCGERGWPDNPIVGPTQTSGGETYHHATGCHAEF